MNWAWVDPLAKDGYIKLFPTDGIDLGEGVEEMVVGIKQVQMEQVDIPARPQLINI